MPTRLHIIDRNFTTGPRAFAEPPMRAPEEASSPDFMMSAEQGGNYASDATLAPAAASPAPNHTWLWIGAALLAFWAMSGKRRR